ncbi:MAG: HAD-IIIA family hydrolase [Bacteroidota bacterium]|nr:HAD-IIIA family hydrolase [Bacteroidota bacterium]MDP4215841.1 HAD-IIIA family hydrolase [Bacteroidota bacterium]MDP4248300.1 HAD-IIIA family hydrolase [Bacteroidota bacterium]
MLDLSLIDKSWTLFLDRDGVINEEKSEGYILHYGEFLFYPGVKEAVRVFAKKFGLILIVTNQRGVGKGLMAESDLRDIHENMVMELVRSGGRVDDIYYCSSLSDEHPMRKPNPGMALQAKKDHPSIDLKRSIMVGNTPGDMEFGKNAGMHTIFLRTTRPDLPLPHPLIDLSFNSLSDLAKVLQ